MANKTLFKSMVGKLVPAADALNEAGGPAYALPPKQALAQYAATGCLNTTFYASAEEQLADRAEALPRRSSRSSSRGPPCTPASTGYMKDMPALLLRDARGPQDRRCWRRCSTA